MIKIFADGADLAEIAKLAKDVRLSGFTTNPTLMRAAGVTDYERFCKQVLDTTDKPVSFEVFAKTTHEIIRQARIINRWGENIYVKIPVTDAEACRVLSFEGIKLNITAVFTSSQVGFLRLTPGVPVIISVFAGRIADAGVDPSHTVQEILNWACHGQEVLWASTRQLYSIIEAEQLGCNIITVPPPMLAKLHLFGKDLLTYSQETVKMFEDDAAAAGYTL